MTLRSRPFNARRSDCYGPLWEAALQLPCWGLEHVPGHRCGGRWTVHHDPPRGQGGTDLTGMLKTCELLHASLDNRGVGEVETRSELLARAGLTEDDIRRLALATVEQAKKIARDRAGLAF